MKRATLILASLAACLVIVVMVATPAAAQDPGPISGALATLAAATAQAEQIRSAQRATAAAVSSEATRQAAIAQATARALSAEATAQAFAVQATSQAQSAQATQSAMDELSRQRAATATEEAQNAQSTRTARSQSIEATATAQVMNAQATATSQAVAIAADATRQAQVTQTYATRQERFSLALLIVELGFIAGALWVLWRLSGTLAAWAVKMRPPAAVEPMFLVSATAANSSAGSAVIEQSEKQKARLPDVVTVVDNPDMVAALDRWAERYDKAHGVNYDN